MNFMFFDITESKFYIRKSKMAAVFKMAAKMAAKNLKIAEIPYFSIYLSVQYMNFMFFDITESKFYIKKSKMAAVFKMAVKMAPKILKIAEIPYFSIYLAMQYMNFMFIDITKSNVDTEKFKMAAVLKMAVKMAAKILKIQ